MKKRMFFIGAGVVVCIAVIAAVGKLLRRIDDCEDYHDSLIDGWEDEDDWDDDSEDDEDISDCGGDCKNCTDCTCETT